MAMQSLPVDRFNKALEEFSKKKVQKVFRDKYAILATEIYQNIVMRTPVLTGRARRNWNIGFQPNFETTEDVAGVLTTGAPTTPYEKAQMAMIRKNIHFGKGLGTTIWIANGLPYINRLDNGYSQKAPAGIVDGAINTALEVVVSRGIRVDSVSITRGST